MTLIHSYDIELNATVLELYFSHALQPPPSPATQNPYTHMRIDLVAIYIFECFFR